jgi:hypothetical protein
MRTRGWKMHDGEPLVCPQTYGANLQTWKTVAVLGSLLCVGGLQAQNYAIDWSTIDGGGGTSTGGGFTVSGTIGQPDAGTLSGGGFTLSGGFWGVVAAIQNPPAPFLTVTRTTTNTVVVSWPGPEAGWKLQATPVLPAMPASWTELPPPYTASGTNLLFIEPVPVGNTFYRLHKP